jgi:hypothetical protein
MTLRYSIGDLIDRLAISNLKHWHLEEEISELTNKYQEVGEEGMSEEDLSRLAGMSKTSVSMNQYRNKVIEAINEFFDDQGKRENREK